MERGYVRVSTTHQDLDRQIDALTAYGIATDLIYADKKSGATFERDAWKRLVCHCKPGDTIVAVTLDRVGRNLRECLNLIHDLTEHGIRIRTLKDPMPIDTTDQSGMGGLAVLMLGLFAEMERTFMRERAAHARAVGEAKGKATGRPRKLTDGQVATARAAIDAGRSAADVASDLGVGRSTLYRALGAEELTGR
ncbi:recombinase family protein [Frankia sp. KB5]|uniref:recombinase family protein n=1 Tax=Frankia sp. KB5 TaxID=683318 RepID=UPI000A116BB3|nr:recombinase family protein [Frankia sp. KB5]ORT48493.1 hypothetical protein KBI5_15440 [Frankia sp. KB5]